MWLTSQLSALDQFFLSFKGSTVAFIAALAVVLGATFALNFFNPKEDIRKRLQGDYFSTDMTFGYRAGDLYAMLDKYQSEDYKAHKCFIALDLIFPLVYSVAWAIMLGYLLPFALPEEYTRVHYLTLVPFAAALFDILENLSMLLILNRYEGNPAGRSDALACFSSAMTIMKTLLVNAILFMLLFGLFKLLLAFFAGRARASSTAA